MARCSSRLHLSHLGLRLCAALSTPFPHVLVANAYSTNVKARSYFQYIKQKIIAPPSPPFDHVCQVGDPVLRSRAAAVDRAAIKGPEVQKIGVPLRILALEYPQKMLDVSSPVSRKVHGLSVQPLRIFVNPELRVLDWQTVLFREACESICGFSATVPRYLSVEVSGLNERGEDTTWQGSGWPARILQHEMDHLDGVLYIDHMDSKTFINVNWLAYNE
ncbi:peptide deformylase, mitochondrial isoform X2 [Phyllopteryx taeniolatus]|uniref:peptide deformylase, mitochondrial isoform X2 n=1 Tax=Phyllopteryx taeniolatus TaxID=161469 RepID=UPI002AD4F25B|nr:peptide deformylase, mitochondrial isoform X2 [Phyllopteryx taeniolatus]